MVFCNAVSKTNKFLSQNFKLNLLKASLRKDECVPTSTLNRRIANKTTCMSQKKLLAKMVKDICSLQIYFHATLFNIFILH